MIYTHVIERLLSHGYLSHVCRIKYCVNKIIGAKCAHGAVRIVALGPFLLSGKETDVFLAKESAFSNRNIFIFIRTGTTKCDFLVKKIPSLATLVVILLARSSFWQVDSFSYPSK